MLWTMYKYIFLEVHWKYNQLYPVWHGFGYIFEIELYVFPHDFIPKSHWWHNNL